MVHMFITYSSSTHAYVHNCIDASLLQWTHTRLTAPHSTLSACFTLHACTVVISKTYSSTPDKELWLQTNVIKARLHSTEAALSVAASSLLSLLERLQQAWAVSILTISDQTDT
jgi:hypothetical protein